MMISKTMARKMNFKDPVRRAKEIVLSTLRPNQRRVWNRDQIDHYESFLADFKHIKHSCRTEVHGFKLHDLLEKEIRNSYWIYRSSLSEQTVLIAKIITKRAIERFRSVRSKNTIEEQEESPKGRKAICVASPATGVGALESAAMCCFDKEEVLFVCSGENSRLKEDIHRRGFPLVVADDPANARWQPDGDDAQFLKELWKALGAVEKLKFFQKVFVYLYTRDALRSLHVYRRFMSRLLASNICPVFAGRPRTPFVNGALLASHDTGAMPVFVSHTIWYRLPCPIGRLYDLSIFSKAILQTDRCKKEVERVSPHVQVAVVGMEKPEKMTVTGQVPLASGDTRLQVGLFLGVNDFISEILPEIAALDIDIFLKTRPPGGNAAAFSYLSGIYENVEICDHADFSMDRFCRKVDVIVGGYSNAVFNAACLGVPVIGYLTGEERRANGFLRPVLIPFDLAASKTADLEELVATLSRLAAARNELETLAELQRRNVSASIPDLDFSSVGKLLVG